MAKKTPNSDDDGGGGDYDWLPVATGQDNSGDDVGTLLGFLLGKPMPTSEARAAIVRILLNGWDMRDTRGIAANLIATLFTGQWLHDRDVPPVWTVDFKKNGKGRSNPYGDMQIALAIQAVRDCGKSYDEAMEWAVETFGIGDRRVRQIYGKNKDEIRKYADSRARQGNDKDTVRELPNRSVKSED